MKLGLFVPNINKTQIKLFSTHRLSFPLIYHDNISSIQKEVQSVSLKIILQDNYIHVSNWIQKGTLPVLQNPLSHPNVHHCHYYPKTIATKTHRLFLPVFLKIYTYKWNYTTHFCVCSCVCGLFCLTSLRLRNALLFLYTVEVQLFSLDCLNIP